MASSRTVYLNDNNSLISPSFPSLQTAGRITTSNSSSLVSIGLNSLTYVGQLNLESSPSLTSISLPSLSSAPEITAFSCPNLLTISISYSQISNDQPHPTIFIPHLFLTPPDSFPKIL